jgi:hypothetical protein
MKTSLAEKFTNLQLFGGFSTETAGINQTVAEVMRENEKKEVERICREM